jgi:UrcA family protein
MKTITTGWATALAVLATAAVAGPAAATASAPTLDPVLRYQEVVRFEDLNLATNGGATRLFERIDRAAHEVCGDDGSPYQIYNARGIRKCEQASIETAVADLHQPKVTAVYDRHFPNAALPIGQASAEPAHVTVLLVG